MSVQPLPGFQSLTTHHCITGSIRHIYCYNDYPISEEMLLGLGAGVGFIYWHMKGTLPFFGGRANHARPGNEGLEHAIGNRTSVGVDSFHTSSQRKAQSALLDLLDAGEPVMVMVDMGFLPYFELPEDFHFGGHAVVVAGYDEASACVLLADRDEALHPVSLDALAQARGSKFKPFPPQNTWFTFDFSLRRPPQPDEIREAIRDVTTGMLEPPIANLGVKGIRKAAKLALKWPDVLNTEELRYTCFNTYMFIDAEGGTGGGIFRYMYGRFLKEAADITGNAQLASIGDELTTIGDRWQGVAENFREAADVDDPARLLPDATEGIMAIADCEEATWQRLHTLVA